MGQYALGAQPTGPMPVATPLPPPVLDSSQSAVGLAGDSVFPWWLHAIPVAVLFIVLLIIVLLDLVLAPAVQS